MSDPTVAIDWSSVITAGAALLGSLAVYLRQRANQQKTEEKVEEVKVAAENGHALREKLVTETEHLRQENAALSLQRDTFRDIVQFINSRPEPQIRAALTSYAERRQVAAYDPKMESLMSGIARPAVPATPTLSQMLPWARWALGIGGGTLAAYGLWAVLERSYGWRIASPESKKPE